MATFKKASCARGLLSWNLLNSVICTQRCCVSRGENILATFKFRSKRFYRQQHHAALCNSAKKQYCGKFIGMTKRNTNKRSLKRRRRISQTSKSNVLVTKLWLKMLIRYWDMVSMLYSRKDTTQPVKVSHEFNVN